MSGSDKHKKIVALNKAMAHELRVRALDELRKAEVSVAPGKKFRGLSPRELERLFECPLSNVSYHVRELEKLGVIEEIGSRQVRGANQHFYRITEWAREPVQNRLDEIS